MMQMTRPTFVQCTVLSISRHSKVYINHPVNLNFCRAIRTGRHEWHEKDNSPPVGFPAIFFEGLDTYWAFETDAQRDKEFLRLMAAYGDVLPEEKK